MVFISLSHTYAYTATAPTVNPLKILEMLRGFWHHLCYLGYYFVDTFFLISGFLLAYLSIPEMQKKKGHINIAVFMVHRVIRLAPIYYFVLMLFVNFFIPHFGTGPAWPFIDYKYSKTCNEYWWANLLFINNFVPTVKQGCMG